MCKKIASLFLIFCLLLPLVSCGAGEKTPAGPITLTDACGRTVTLDKPAETVVSCYYVSTYAVLALGLSDRLVGVENKANTRPIYSLADADIVNLPAVGTMKESNTELIASLAPDLVIMPKKLLESAETLAQLGLNVLVVNPESHEDLCAALSLIGQACGVSEKADALIAYYEAKRQSLTALTEKADKPTVYMGGNSSYLTAAPKDMYQSTLISLAGGVNAGDSLEGSYWTEVSYETVLTMNPDVIVLPCGADYSPEDIAKDPQLASLTAVKNGAVYAMPSQLEEWDSPIPSGILGAMWLSSVLHPELYSADTFEKEAAAFYETFYGFTPDASLLK
ncbi:MAG: ABC transporter substrate-binding protein [Clostridia bacterium]|nr:ABC transporter substrate-binding protein [Clostridia bacterium]